MSEYNCDDCELDCSTIVKALCREALIDDCKQLEAKNKELKENLIEYGRHGEGCSGQWDKKYRCKCGWREVEKALKG